MIAIILFYLLGCGLGVLLFLAGFHFGLFAGDSIIFYRGLKILLASSLVQWILLTLIIHRLLERRISIVHAFATAMASIAVMSSFLIVVPVSLDRSLSIFLLGYMHNIGHPLTQEELETSLHQIYITKYAAVERRMREQEVTGNVAVTPDGKYQLSAQGERFVQFSNWVALSFDIDSRYLNPDVTQLPQNRSRAR